MRMLIDSPIYQLEKADSNPNLETSVNTTANSNTNNLKLTKTTVGLLFFFGLLKFTLHVFFLPRYGLHADELYYIHLGKDFQWGFPDISPLVTWVAGLSAKLFGDSVAAWRIIPTLFSSFTVVLTGLIAHYLGAKRLGIIVACLAIIWSPSFLATSYLLQPVVFDEFLWTFFAFVLLRYFQTQKPTYLLLSGAVLGIGMLNKYTIFMYLVTLGLASLIVFKGRLKVGFPALIGAAILFLVMMMPNILWQAQHGFPVFNFLGLVGQQAFVLNIPDYLFQLVFFHGAGVSVWMAGFLYLFLSKKGGRYLLIWPISTLLLVVALALLKGKLYYGLGMFPFLFAAGGYCWEIMLTRLSRVKKTIFLLMISLFGILSLPLVIPILSMGNCKTYIRQMVALTSFSRPMTWEDGSQGSIPQFFADMSGWEIAANKVGLAVNEIENQPAKYILTDDYAIAGALKRYVKINNLQIISASNSFILESPPELVGTSLIYLSKEPISKVEKMAQGVSFIEALDVENSHLKGINIYVLTRVNENFNQVYQLKRNQFYPYAAGKSQSPYKPNLGFWFSVNNWFTD